MDRSLLRVCALLAVAAWCVPARAAAQNMSGLAGVWTLNRSLSEFPKEIGFNLEGLPAPDGDSRSSGGGRGRRGSGDDEAARAAAGLFNRPESYDDARRRQLLIAEVRNPPMRQVVVETSAAVTITNELGQSRTLHPNGREESVEIQGVPFTVTAKREGDRLVAVYHVEQNRDVQYTYLSSYSSPAAVSPTRLVVEVQLLEHGTGTGDKATRVYEPGTGTDVVTPARAAAAPASPGQQAPAGQQTPAGQPATASFDQRPGAEFKGLKSLGVLVEDLGAEAVACGLNRDAIEDALAKRLSTGGLTVRKNSDDDTYVYVNVITTNTPTAGCVSRYDAFLYTHAIARLAYREQPVLVQVSLMHRGGLGASAASVHAAAVSRGLEGYIDLFLAQIRDANK